MFCHHLIKSDSGFLKGRFQVQLIYRLSVPDPDKSNPDLMFQIFYICKNESLGVKKRDETSVGFRCRYIT